MTIHTGQPPVSIDAREGHENQSRRAWAVTAGAGLLLMSVLAGFGNFVAVDGLVTTGDAARTAQNIAESEGLFRAGIASLFLVIVLDVVVACGLYVVFRPVSNGLSMLAAAFRLVYAGVFMVALGHLLGALRLLGTDGVLLEINAFTDLWVAGLGLFGVHLLLLGYLAYRSGFVPKFLGALLVVAGFGYLADGISVIISPTPWTVSSYTFVGEFLLALWLVIRGRRLAA
jgi:hypothetical protein